MDSPRLGSQEAFLPKEPAWGYPDHANFAISQPAAQSQSLDGCAQPAVLPPITTRSRTQLPFADALSSSNDASKVPQNIPNERAPNLPTQSSVLQNDCPVMAFGLEQHPMHVPVDSQSPSTAAYERRKRRATTSYQYRQRRKKKGQETTRNIANLEKELRETKEKVDFYLSERNYFRELVWRQHQGMPQRPLSPKAT